MLILNRLCSNLFGTQGVFIYDRKVLCHTYELPWRGNLKDQSCIPCGQYDVIKAVAPRFGDCFYLKHVPGRDSILIHPGNNSKDTRGCILPGLDTCDVGVIHSRSAMHRLLTNLPSNFQLIIREA